MSTSPTTPAFPPLDRLVRGRGPGLLLAHGATGGIRENYGPLLDALAEHHRVVGPDYPGSGRTPRAGEPLRLDRLADALVAAADAEGLGTFAVLGYSLGGALAVRIAARHPERVTALVLTASFATPSPRMLLLLDEMIDHLTSPDRAAAARWSLLAGAGAPFLDGLPKERLGELLAAFTGPANPGLADQADLVRRTDVAADLPGIRVPTLVISTLHDHLATPHHHRQLAEGIPGAEWAELPSGHLPFIEAPAEWLELITKFLDRASAPA
ncbi:alpha/beta fold hydrolase [Streptomyces hoynatensis]|uniref:Alpha/beta hydrolase n=1 Tax=Streptomyces hoynatensis TaxID=1141874 RepID=A0A3A9YNS9_9ACTN|nr:alpha/beta hydrolase [Streptomyces hoynatensis]RKN37798.1 alpha/beta hydrolase [Streptomyces hoynatensis]